MSRNLSMGLIGAGIVLVAFAVLEHLFVTVRVLPHMAIYLGVIAVVVAGIGIYGLLAAAKGTAATKQGEQGPQWPGSTPDSSS